MLLLRSFCPILLNLQNRVNLVARRLYIHPESPQTRLIAQAVQFLRNSGVVIYPTATAYALACCLGDKEGETRLRAIRGLSPEHDLTVLCLDLRQVGQYALLNNTAFRMLKSLLPGPYTFILPSGQNIPRRLFIKRRSEIGFRVADHPVAMALVSEIGAPLLTTSLMLAGANDPMSDPDDIFQALGPQVDCFLDVGFVGQNQTTVLDLTAAVPVVIRQGAGMLPQ